MIYCPKCGGKLGMQEEKKEVVHYAFSGNDRDRFKKTN